MEPTPTHPRTEWPAWAVWAAVFAAVAFLELGVPAIVNLIGDLL